MMTKPLVGATTLRAPCRSLGAWVLNGAVLLAATAPAVGFSQNVAAPEAPQAPAVGVVPTTPAAAAPVMPMPQPQVVPAVSPAMPQQTPQALQAPAVSAPAPQPVAVPTLATARVLSVTSVAQPASATRLVCSDVAEMPAPTSGAGAVAGALVGAAVGSQVGGGAGNALATAAGLVGGALIGDKAEQGGRTQTVRQCVTHSGVGPSVAYQVTYEFSGQQYSTMLPYHPGATLQVQVSPVVETTTAAAPPLPTAVSHTVVVAAPSYGYYGPYGYSAYAPYWGAPVVVGVGVGRYWGGRPYRGWHGHRRW